MWSFATVINFPGKRKWKVKFIGKLLQNPRQGLAANSSINSNKDGIMCGIAVEKVRTSPGPTRLA